MARRSRPTEEDEGTWVDVALIHKDPDQTPRKGEGSSRFEHNVGLEGYERGTGEEVVREPVLKRPREKDPAAKDLFSD